MDPGFVPPSGSMNPAATVASVPSDPIRAFHAEVAEAHRDGASSNDIVQMLDAWFVAQGLPTVIYA